MTESEESSSVGSHRNARLLFNIGGQRHETFVSTLKAIPGSRLSWISENYQILKHSPAYDAEKKEFFFDRNPTCFEAILNYFRTGQLHYPTNICGSVFEFELKFWGVDEAQMQSCCWEEFAKNREKDAKLKGFKGPLFIDDDEDDEDEPKCSLRTIRLKMWRFLDDAYSSQAARIHAYVVYIFLFLYILLPILTSMKSIQDSNKVHVIKVVEIILTCYFSLEFLLRLILCPNRREFFKDHSNIVDVISMVPVYLEWIINNKGYSHYTDVLAIFRIVKVFRTFRYNYTLQVLANTLKESLPELSLLVFLMLLLATIFAYASYFIEGRLDGTLFKSIPDCLWWSFITMTTVGYGDMAPKSWLGQIVGIMCAVCGLLMVALPVSVVATNFSIYYSYAKARISLPPKMKVKLAEHANSFMGHNTVKDDVSNKRSIKVAPVTNGNVENGQVANGNVKKGAFLTVESKSRRANELPPLESHSYNIWLETIKKLKENGHIKSARKMDLAALVMALSSKGDWSAPT